MTNMTAVEWLISQYIKDGFFKKGVYEQAMEIEKQQIKDAYGKISMFSEQLYNETYGSKGSDDQVPDVRKMVEDDNYLTPVDWLMDRIKWINRETYDYLIKEGQYDRAKRMESSTSSQTEISETEEYTSCPICNGTSINGFCSTPNCAYSLYEPDKDDLETTPTSSQTISDEEIEKEILHRPMTVLEERAFRSACKWYREQLKKK